jgi:hypothetical protein
MIRRIISTLALCFAPLLYVTVIEPMDFSAPTLYTEYFEAQSSGYSYRWTSDADIQTLECQIYDLCLWVDVKGPECPDELYLSVSYYDAHDNWITENRVVIPGAGGDRFDSVEIGTELDFDFAFYMVTDVWCSAGVPTGLSEI